MLSLIPTSSISLKLLPGSSAPPTALNAFHCGVRHCRCRHFVEPSACGSSLICECCGHAAMYHSPKRTQRQMTSDKGEPWPLLHGGEAPPTTSHAAIKATETLVEPSSLLLDARLAKARQHEEAAQQKEKEAILCLSTNPSAALGLIRDAFKCSVEALEEVENIAARWTADPLQMKEHMKRLVERCDRLSVYLQIEASRRGPSPPPTSETKKVTVMSVKGQEREEMNENKTVGPSASLSSVEGQSATLQLSCCGVTAFAGAHFCSFCGKPFPSSSSSPSSTAHHLSTQGSLHASKIQLSTRSKTTSPTQRPEGKHLTPQELTAFIQKAGPLTNGTKKKNSKRVSTIGKEGR